MEKKLVTRLTILIVTFSLVIALGAAFWRASHRAGGEENPHHTHHHSRGFMAENLAC